MHADRSLSLPHSPVTDLIQPSVRLQADPVVYVCDGIAIPHWKREFENWTDLNVIVLQGNRADRDMIKLYEYYFWNTNGDIAHSQHFKFNIMLTTYEVALTEVSQLSKIFWRWVVVDEAHRLKNKNSKLFGALKNIRSEHRVILTGTPVQNNTTELWNLLHFIDPHRFHEAEQFQRDFGDVKNSEQLERLHSELKPYLLRRMKEDVAKNVRIPFCMLPHASA